jgi:hypothetical protein
MQILKAGQFSMTRKQRQMKTGGAKPVFTIYVDTTRMNSTTASEITQFMNQRVRGRGPRWTFAKRKDAEKVWVYITMKWA